MTNVKIPRRYTTAILNSMGGGVVPHIGLEYIAVGRKQEVEAILGDLQNIAEGGGAFRFIVGQYGSGKSFLLQLARGNALERNYLVADADLSPERRLTGTKGQGLKLYRELIAHLSTKARPEGNAMESLLQRWIMELQRQVEADGVSSEAEGFYDGVEARIHAVALELQSYVYGYDLACVLQKYWQGYRMEDDALRQGALRWLRGEYERKADARFLGVTQIISDETWYEFLKLLAIMSVKLGYQGLLVLLDEEVNLYKITNRVSRENNYEKLLTMFNDIMQGRTEYLGVFVGGTPQSVEDERRGLFSYQALKSRLQQSRLAKEGLADFSGPIIRLKTLTNEEIYLLLERLMNVFCAHHHLEENLLTHEQLVAFMQTASDRLGADRLLTPREVTRDFISLMNLLQQNPDETFEKLMGEGKVAIRASESDPDDLDDDAFAVFDL